MILSQLKMKEILNYLENFKFTGSHISGVRVTAMVMAGKMLNIPIIDTMAHSRVMMFQRDLTILMSIMWIYLRNHGQLNRN